MKVPKVALITQCLWDWGWRELSRVEMRAGEPRLDIRWMRLMVSNGLLLCALFNQATAGAKWL